MPQVLIIVFSIAAALGAGAIGAVQLRRRSLRTNDAMFRCALRRVSGEVEGVRDQFARSAAYATWARDVLVVWNGIALSRLQLLEVVTAGHRLDERNVGGPHGVGSHPLVLTVALEGGAVIEVAAARSDREMLLQPFRRRGAVHRRRRDPRVLEEAARLVRRARRKSEERKKQELQR